MNLFEKVAFYYQSVKNRLFKFALVGISGVIVNEGLLAFFTEVHAISVPLAGAIAIETSILTNFLLNNFWTWRDSRKKSFWLRLLQYHSVSLIAGLVNYLILIGLTYLGWHHLLANLVGIAFATMINFLINHHWTFAKKVSET